MAPTSRKNDVEKVGKRREMRKERMAGLWAVVV